MSELKNLTCSCCGGTINRSTMKCEYCGTEYEIKNDIPIIRIEKFNNTVKEYKACVLVNDCDISIGGDAYMKYALQKLCEKMMPAVMEGMRVRICQDPANLQTQVEGSLKIVVPRE